MLDGEPKFQGRPHLWSACCRRFSEGILFCDSSATERSFRARIGVQGQCTCRLSC
jgi:hypothetical protein